MQTALFTDVEHLEPREAELFQQLQVHKYFLNKDIPEELTIEQAFDSWSRVVHGPISSSIFDEALDLEFPDVPEDELFCQVTRHWHFMKDGGRIEVTPLEAVLDYGARFAETEESRTSYSLKKHFLFSQ